MSSRPESSAGAPAKGPEGPVPNPPPPLSSLRIQRCPSPSQPPCQAAPASPRPPLAPGPGTISREVAKLTWAVAVLVLGSSGVFLFLESGHPEAPYFHDGLYYMIVTMTTVGYGDVVPSTPAGRAWMCCFILAAIVIVPPRINKFITVMNERRFKGAFKGTYLMQHMVLIGNIDCVTLDTFLREFYHRNHGPVALDLCILMPEEPDATVRQLLNGEQCGGERSAFLQGNPLCLDDLRRVRVNTAQAVFIVSAKVIGDFAQASDEKTLLTILAIRRISRTVPIYVQVRPGAEAFLRDQ